MRGSVRGRHSCEERAPYMVDWRTGASGWKRGASGTVNHVRDLFPNRIRAGPGRFPGDSAKSCTLAPPSCFAGMAVARVAAPAA